LQQRSIGRSAAACPPQHSSPNEQGTVTQQHMSCGIAPLQHLRLFAAAPGTGMTRAWCVSSPAACSTWQPWASQSLSQVRSAVRTVWCIVTWVPLGQLAVLGGMRGSVHRCCAVAALAANCTGYASCRPRPDNMMCLSALRHAVLCCGAGFLMLAVNWSAIHAECLMPHERTHGCDLLSVAIHKHPFRDHSRGLVRSNLICSGVGGGQISWC
jgi:hypothetical protein